MRTSCVKNGLIACVILLFIGVAVQTSIAVDTIGKCSMPISNGHTLYVGGSGEGNYTKIQDAINHASDGDTVFVYDDSSPYNEILHIEKSINLIGEDKNTTIIQKNLGELIFISSDWVKVRGFTLTTAWGCDAVRLWGSDYSIITDNIISNFGNGIIIIGSSENIISGNKISSNDGEGIYLRDAARNIITGNKISSNKEKGIYLDSKSPRNVITCNTISNNDDGITIGYHSPSNIISNNIISNNLCGINISSSFNFMIKNDFLNNEQDAFFSGSIKVTLKFGYYGNIDWRVDFHPASRNHWLRNYWDGNKPQPVRINGKKSFCFCLANSTSDIKWDFYIPWVNFDWFPAKEPYDI